MLTIRDLTAINLINIKENMTGSECIGVALEAKQSCAWFNIWMGDFTEIPGPWMISKKLKIPQKKAMLTTSLLLPRKLYKCIH